MKHPKRQPPAHRKRPIGKNEGQSISHTPKGEQEYQSYLDELIVKPAEEHKGSK